MRNPQDGALKAHLAGFLLYGSIEGFDPSRLWIGFCMALKYSISFISRL